MFALIILATTPGTGAEHERNTHGHIMSQGKARTEPPPLSAQGLCLWPGPVPQRSLLTHLTAGLIIAFIPVGVLQSYFLKRFHLEILLML